MEHTYHPLCISEISQVRVVNRRRGRARRSTGLLGFEWHTHQFLQALPAEMLTSLICLMALTVGVQATGCNRPVIELDDVGAPIGVRGIPWANVEDPAATLPLP